MFSVTSNSARPSTELLSSLAALASAGLVSAGSEAMAVKGKKSNQQQSDHLICEVREFESFAHIPRHPSVSRFVARERENTVTTVARSARAAEPSSGDLSSPGESDL